MDFSEYHVLAVDDDSFLLDLVEVALQKIGFEQIEKAQDGHIALSQIDNPNNNINFILCDLNMPKMDGVEFLRHLASRKFQGNIVLLSGEDKKIIEVTGNLAKEHHLNILGSLEKPFDYEELVKLINIKKTLNDTPQFSKKAPIELTKDDLKKALENEEIILFYQPKINIKTKKLVGFESLARWDHPTHGILGPDLFIDLAEKNKLINKLTHRIITLAVKQRALWDNLDSNIRISINLSVEDLNQLDLPEFIETQVSSNGLDPTQFMLEITESRLIEHLSTVLEVITRLSLKRFSLSIDDFGTGYSSMEQLQRIPFSELKIDRAFVYQADQKPSAKAILESSVLLAKKLKIETIAEGVETQNRLGYSCCRWL